MGCRVFGLLATSGSRSRNLVRNVHALSGDKLLPCNYNPAAFAKGEFP
jgi:hypothetical protein